MRRALTVGALAGAVLGLVAVAVTEPFWLGMAWVALERRRPDPPVMVIVAAHPLPPGAEIVDEDLYAVQIPARYLPEGVFLSPEHVVGRTVTEGILANEFVRAEVLGGQQHPDWLRRWTECNEGCDPVREPIVTWWRTFSEGPEAFDYRTSVAWLLRDRAHDETAHQLVREALGESLRIASDSGSPPETAHAAWRRAHALCPLRPSGPPLPAAEPPPAEAAAAIDACLALP